MPKFCQKAFFIIFVMSYFCLTGCNTESSSVILEVEEKHYQRGQRMLKEGRNEEALEAFVKVTQKRPEAPESHLEIGRLYLQVLKDPIASIYHFRKYLEFKPEAPQSNIVRQLIETAKKEFLKELPGQPSMDTKNAEELNLLSAVKYLKKENSELKKEVRALRNRAPVTAEQASVSKAVPLTSPMMITQGNRSLVAPPSEYVVESGDTLSSISYKLFGTTGRWQDIYDANQSSLANPHALKVGQALAVPR